MARTKEFDEVTVVDKAVELFWCKGYNGASMQDVVDNLALSRSSIYDTFGDKRQLFLLALNRYRQQTAGALIELLNRSENTLFTIEQLFAVAVEESLDNKLAKGCFMVNTTIELALHDAEVAQIVNANAQDVEEAFYQTIKRGQEQGDVAATHDARAIARFLLNTISGIRVAAKSGTDRGVYDDIVKVALSVLN